MTILKTTPKKTESEFRNLITVKQPATSFRTQKKHGRVLDEMRFSFNIFNSSLCCAVGARICRVSSICQLSKFPKQLGEGCQLSLTGSNPLNQEEWIFLNGISIPKNQLNKHCRPFKQTLEFRNLITFLEYFPKLNKERMLRLHQKQPP